MIEIENVTKVYRMGEVEVRALNGVSLCVNEGEWVAITGPSGSGKSTLMNVIGCLDQPTSGSYKLDGLDVSRMNDTQLANVRNRKIGFVFQTFNLIQRTTAVDNVAVPLFYARRTQVREPAMRALQRVGRLAFWVVAGMLVYAAMLLLLGIRPRQLVLQKVDTDE